MNFLDSAKSQLNSESLSSLAGHLGIDPSVLPQLIEDALPSLFAIVHNAALDPSKADLLAQFLSETDNSILDTPDTALTEYGPQLMRGGKSGLARLLGPQLTDYIVPLAKSTGLGEGKVGSALGTLAPFVFALLGQQAKDASGLLHLLTKEEISAPAPDTKIAPKEEAPQKSYLPDPTKKRYKRPFPKRKAILLVIALALVAALLFWLVGTGVIPLPTSEPTQDPPIESDSVPTPETTISPEASS